MALLKLQQIVEVEYADDYLFILFEATLIMYCSAPILTEA